MRSSTESVSLIVSPKALLVEPHRASPAEALLDVTESSWVVQYRLAQRCWY